MLRFRSTGYRPPDYRVVVRYGPGWKPAYPGQYQDGVWQFALPEMTADTDLAFRFVILDDAGHMCMLSETLRAQPASVESREFIERDVRLRTVSRPLSALVRGMDSHRTSAALVYGVVAAVFVLSSVLFAVRAAFARDLLQAGLALILLGLAGAVGYEAEAVREGGDPSDPDPTIGRVAGLAFLQHPASWLLILVGNMGLAGALIIHFTSWINSFNPWVLVVAIAAYLGGAAAAMIAARYFRTWFLP